MVVRAKKNLGQHFLTDEAIAAKIVNSLKTDEVNHVLEIGPGMGVLTKYLLQNTGFETSVIEIDRESVEYLKKHQPVIKERIIEGDFLKLDLNSLFSGKPVAVIGNFPYNISSQIFFRILQSRGQIPEVVCMLQDEVAQRICSGPGSKVYGILSVFLQVWYNIEYLFKVPPEVFNPPPKVNSAVIRLVRNNVTDLGCNEKLFHSIVKQTFNQRRKMLRNSLRNFTSALEELNADLLTKRPEQLSVEDFVNLTNDIERLMVNG
jgi:16S rRNA (adenine1518-N6/adenine1519-N6)-dimethyltransferase